MGSTLYSDIFNYQSQGQQRFYAKNLLMMTLLDHTKFHKKYTFLW